MKKRLFLTTIIGLFLTTATINCGKAGTEIGGGQASAGDVGNIVAVAAGSKDHTTLVVAVKAADLLDSLANAGPFTVFAPTNEAFDKLPKGTLEGLLKSDKIEDLKNILEYHVIVGTYKVDGLHDGEVIGMVNGDKITITIKDGKPLINGIAKILGSVVATNGVVHVIDTVLLPPAPAK